MGNRKPEPESTFLHSWDGKFRRPADLWQPNFNLPEGGSLLWLYEGQTQYWGFVVTARAGVWTPEQFRGALAMVVANYDRNCPGTEWRTLEDTTDDAVIARRRLLPCRSWQMSEDYYSGGQLMWLAADAKIRELTHDKKSLDTFAQSFYGMDDGSYVTRTYTLDDVMDALDQMVKYDWRGFLDRNVYAPVPPLASEIEAAGWKLVYTDTDTDTEYKRAYDAAPQSVPVLEQNFLTADVSRTHDFESVGKPTRPRRPQKNRRRIPKAPRVNEITFVEREHYAHEIQEAAEKWVNRGTVYQAKQRRAVRVKRSSYWRLL